MSRPTLGIVWPRFPDLSDESVALETGRFADVVLTTGSLADNIAETGMVALGKTMALARLVADRACRVQVYATEAYRTLDASRPIGVDPTGEHGVIVDAAIMADNLTLDLMPQPRGSNLDDPRVAELYYRITNMSGGTSTVAVTFTRQLLEV